MKGAIDICLCGDLLISRRMPRNMPKELVDVSEILKQYECCLGNIETTIRIDEG